MLNYKYTYNNINEEELEIIIKNLKLSEFTRKNGFIYFINNKNVTTARYWINEKLLDSDINILKTI